MKAQRTQGDVEKQIYTNKDTHEEPNKETK